MQVWFSGIIAACHAVDPGSIPGTCKYVLGPEVMIIIKESSSYAQKGDADEIDYDGI